jgi:hypothetical protein
LKAVDSISKEEGHVCPTNPLIKKNNKQTNEKYTNIVLEIFGSPAHYLSNVVGCPAY